MLFLLVHRRLVLWMVALSLLISLSDPVNGQVAAKHWLDSLSSLVKSYDELLSRVAREKESSFDVDLAAALDELDRQREEARVDCLANRLLAEEYQPYDFDIRETMWCKGWGTHAGSSIELAEFDLKVSETSDREPDAGFIGNRVEARFPVPLVPEPEWLVAIRAKVWSGFKVRMQSDWDFALSNSKYISEKIQIVVSSIDRQRIENHVASMPSLRGIFGRYVLPYEVGITTEEYTAITIQLWKELQAKAGENSILSQSTWYQLRATSLEPIYDLVTLIPSLFTVTQR